MDKATQAAPPEAQQAVLAFLKFKAQLVQASDPLKKAIEELARDINKEFSLDVDAQKGGRPLLTDVGKGLLTHFSGNPDTLDADLKKLSDVVEKHQGALTKEGSEVGAALLAAIKAPAATKPVTPVDAPAGPSRSLGGWMEAAGFGNFVRSGGDFLTYLKNLIIETGRSIRGVGDGQNGFLNLAGDFVGALPNWGGTIAAVSLLMFLGPIKLVAALAALVGGAGYAVANNGSQKTPTDQQVAEAATPPTAQKGAAPKAPPTAQKGAAAAQGPRTTAVDGSGPFSVPAGEVDKLGGPWSNKDNPVNGERMPAGALSNKVALLAATA